LWVWVVWLWLDRNGLGDREWGVVCDSDWSVRIGWGVGIGQWGWGNHSSLCDGHERKNNNSLEHFDYFESKSHSEWLL